MSVRIVRQEQETFNGQWPSGGILERSHAVEGRALSAEPGASPGWTATVGVAVLAGGADGLSCRFQNLL
jgi:hypothetical protein